VRAGGRPRRRARRPDLPSGYREVTGEPGLRDVRGAAQPGQDLRAADGRDGAGSRRARQAVQRDRARRATVLPVLAGRLPRTALRCMWDRTPLLSRWSGSFQRPAGQPGRAAAHRRAGERHDRRRCTSHQGDRPGRPRRRRAGRGVGRAHRCRRPTARAFDLLPGHTCVERAAPGVLGRALEDVRERPDRSSLVPRRSGR
jgi:hypothetical protein